MKTRLKLFASALLFIALNAYSMPANQAFSSGFMPSAWPAPTLSANEGTSSNNQAKKPNKSKAKKGGGVRFYEGSAETRRERERRLLRECKGRPNSGACEGYTR